MGGGCLRGMTFANGTPVERPNLRGVMISAAFDYDMLYPGHRYGQAFVAAEKIMSTFNCHDRTLRKWPKTSWRGCEALGYVGMNAGRLGQYRHKFCQVNTYPENGTSHYLGPHLENPRFMSAYCCTAFGGITSGVPAVGTQVDVIEKPAAPACEEPVAKPAITTKKEDEPTLAEPPVEEAKQPEKSGQEARSTKSRGSARTGKQAA
jgi:hypothetical protein